MKELSIVVAMLTLILGPFQGIGQKNRKIDQWENLTAITPGIKSHVVPALWGGLPSLKPKSRFTILEAEGPGVVRNIHATSLVYGPGRHGFTGNSPGAQRVIIRVYYDNESMPSIEMPFMDFFGDIQCQSSFFSTEYFSKVSQSHNFRLPMPFREHIKIELENPTDENLWGYAEIQWDELMDLPEYTGYLKTDFRSGSFTADSVIELLNIKTGGSIVAHWLQYENEKSGRGELLCEADQQLYLDGDVEPTLNHLGSEDLYGYSWGFHMVQSDGYGAILKVENLNPAGSRVAVIRCREYDVIRFQQSCRWLLTYENDQGAAEAMGTSPIDFRHCVYYYARPIN